MGAEQALLGVGDNLREFFHLVRALERGEVGPGEQLLVAGCDHGAGIGDGFDRLRTGFPENGVEKERDVGKLSLERSLCGRNPGLDFKIIFLVSGHAGAELHDGIVRGIIKKKRIQAELAAEIVKQQSLADSCFGDDVIGAGVLVAVQGKNFERGIDDAVLFFFFEVVEFFIHGIARVPAAEILTELVCIESTIACRSLRDKGTYHSLRGWTQG